jgi:hypothetical protein
VLSEVRRPRAASELHHAIDRGWFQRYSLSSDEEFAWYPIFVDARRVLAPAK